MMLNSTGRLCCWFIGVVCMGLLGCSGRLQPDSAHVSSAGSGVSPAAANSNSTIYAFKIKDIDGWPVALSRYHGKVLLVVNVASECRFTGQYANLQQLYMTYRDRGFVVLGFPANNFGHQEPGTNAEIKEFMARRFNLLFPLFSKISVAGEDMHPLYQCLTHSETNDAFGGPITWNFTKFLIDRNGTTIARFPPEMDPLDPQIIAAVEAALQ